MCAIDIGTGERCRREIEIDAHPDEVWRVAARPGEWLGDDAGDVAGMEEGAAITVHEAGGERRGVVEVVQPPVDGHAGRLVWWWWHDDEPATRVEVLVIGGAESTRVVVVESRPATGPVMGARWARRLRRLDTGVAAPALVLV